MSDLRSLFEEAGCADVKTYIQSGNVVYSANQTLAAKVPKLITAALESELSLKVPIVVRSGAALRRIGKRHPFGADADDLKFLHVMFLAEKPTSAKVKKLDPARSPPDVFVVKGAEAYLHYPGGSARSKLTNDYFDRTLCTISTMRNWKTVQKLVEMVG